MTELNMEMRPVRIPSESPFKKIIKMLYTEQEEVDPYITIIPATTISAHSHSFLPVTSVILLQSDPICSQEWNKFHKHAPYKNFGSQCTKCISWLMNRLCLAVGKLCLGFVLRLLRLEFWLHSSILGVLKPSYAILILRFLFYKVEPP